MHVSIEIVVRSNPPKHFPNSSTIDRDYVLKIVMCGKLFSFIARSFSNFFMTFDNIVIMSLLNLNSTL